MMLSVIIAAGGTGNRFGGKMPKQFLELDDGVPMIVKSMMPFNGIADNFIISVNSLYRDYCKKILPSNLLSRTIIVDGGETRYESVKNALRALPSQTDMVAIHDAARPYVDVELIRKALEMAMQKGAVVPVIPIVDSIRKIDDSGRSVACDRKHYVVVQTPQIFSKDILVKSYDRPYVSSFTDDASVVESAGYQIYTSEGDVKNIKVTFPSDID